MRSQKSPKSRLLARLDTALAKARHPLEQACLRAERAGFLARLGHFDEARAVIASLHTQFDPHPVAAVSARLCLAEGWMLHFGSLSADARDKMKRAQALSAASGLAHEHALSSAWLAHMDYMADDIDAMVRNVSLALRVAEPQDHAARARACMVVALAYDFAERADRAQHWYIRAREHATADGDETALSALNFNISSHHVHRVAQSAVLGGDSQVCARHAAAVSEAAANFDAWVGALSLDALVPMQQATIALIQGRHAEALDLYQRHFDDACRQGMSRLSARYLADMAWCRWHLGDAHGAARDAAQAAERIDAAMQPDDKAVAHARLAALYRLLGDEAAAAHHASVGRDDWGVHRHAQAAIVAALEAAHLIG